MTDYRASQEITDFVADLLRSQIVSDIEFYFGNLHIRNLNEIGDLVSSGRIEVWIHPEYPRGEAEYDPNQNRIYLSSKSIDNNLTKISIVHEAVHAHFDYHRCSGIRVGEESAAYVADRIFANNAGIPYSAAGDPIRWAALRIVQRLSPNGGGRVGRDDYQALWRAVSRDPTYKPARNIPIENDGIW